MKSLAPNRHGLMRACRRLLSASASTTIGHVAQQPSSKVKDAAVRQEIKVPPKQRVRRSIESELAPSERFITKPLSMCVKAFCTAESYDLAGVKSSLRKWFSISDLPYASFLHARSRDGHDVFIFKNGSFVVWGIQGDFGENNALIQVIEDLKQTVKPHEFGSLAVERVETEEMEWTESESGKSRIVSDSLLEVHRDRNQQLSSMWAKLALSNGLSDSVKLAVLEGLLDKHVEKVKSIPVVLEKGRRIPVGRAATLRLIGELLHFRAALNLDSEFLDTPDVYWSQPELEELYKSMSRSLDTKQRIAVLNKKMDYAEQIAEILRSHLNESHMLRLEWAIVLLVGFEVVNSIFWWLI